MGETLRSLASRLLRRGGPTPTLELGFGSWDRLDSPVLAVCHPHWRGVRAAARAFDNPIVACDDLVRLGPEIVAGATESGVEVIVVHAYPPGTDALLESAHDAGLSTRAVVHSSMAQHGAETWEADVVTRLIELAEAGVVDRIGFVKAGLAEAFRALGVPAEHTPNRSPRLPEFERRHLGDGSHIGVFAEPFWRKNVVTQLGAAAILGGTAHVLARPPVGYLAPMRIIEHGELPWPEFVALQGSVDLNLYVTLSECHPMSPMESYLAGVPCLMSRTSEVFADDEELWDLTTVAEADNPASIARAARRLLGHRAEAVDRAKAWMRTADAEAAERWAAFVAK
jgi:hypothetical protein